MDKDFTTDVDEDPEDPIPFDDPFPPRMLRRHYRRGENSGDGDYGPSHPWDAPGMSVKDFI